MTRLEQAKHPDTSPEVLVEILGDISSAVPHENHEREYAARNPNLPASAIEDIARRGVKFLKFYAAANSTMSLEAFELFAQDSDLWGNLTANPSTPLHFFVRVVREGRSRDWQQVSNFAMCSIARSSRTPVSILVELLKDPHPMVRSYLTQNPNMPEWALWQLAADEDPQVRRYLCYRPELPFGLQIQLAQRETDPTVLRWMSESTSTPPKMKLWLTSDYRDSMSLEEFLEATK